ncbi:prophage side tail fiber protein homolog StfR-like isoform X1 [Penaeus japonicus]|uniref:prophage side tail fiber protein homolog StfR-like isoform X1 n=1 Tax=Penaeus japonicus TaxID=27405 RepID=UPI001C7125D9|nr:prophage side tail fiber protein homolog StfR-like isoform X1 [Penaeus japonicus]XP_042887101.1 prophage side tail fiber protein homolog StfR-like isoform X1 [Penaeus japonicus]
MNSLVIVAAVLAATHAAPQGHGGIRFTQKEYNGLQQALGYRVPVGIYSANQVFSMVEEYPTDYVVLNLPGLSAGGGGSGYSSRSGVAQARTGALPADDEVAETFSEVVEEAVEAVEEAAEEAAEVAVNRNLLVQEAVLAMQEQQTAASGGAVVESRSSSSPALNDETAAPSIPASPTAETAVRSAGSPAANVETAEAVTEAAAETTATAAATTEAATESGATAMVNDTAAQPAAAGLAADAEDVAAAAESARTKRQDSDLTAAEELSFAFAGLGSLVGSNVGRYLDATFSANADLIQGFENTGLLILDQVEDRLRKRQERINKLRASSSSSNS